MGYTHIITILEDASPRYIQQEGRSHTDLCCELGQKIASLCKTHGNPVSRSTEPKTKSLGDWVNGIAWRGLPDSAHDALFYWGAALKPLSEADDKELDIAEKLVKREKGGRAKQ